MERAEGTDVRCGCVAYIFRHEVEVVICAALRPQRKLALQWAVAS